MGCFSKIQLPAVKPGFWQPGVRLGGTCSIILVISVLFVFFSGCRDKSTNPPELPAYQILEVKVTPNPVASEGTTFFTVLTDDSVEAPYRFGWQLESEHDSVQDSLVETNRFEWEAPADTGAYEHSVWIETEDGEALSSNFSFLVNVVPEEPPPPQPTTIVDVEVIPHPVTSRDITQCTVIIADEEDDRYHFRWQLEQPNGTQKDTVTLTNKLDWPAPEQSGQYGHQVEVETESGESLSSVHNFSVTVEAEEPIDTTLSGKIVFSAKDEHGDSQIYSINADDLEPTQLTDFPPDGEAAYPSWSPDGEQIVFSSFKYGTSIGPALWVMDADGSNQRVLYDPEPDNEHQPPLAGNNPRWSPDGNKIVFDLCMNCQISTNHVIYVFDLETKEVTKLTELSPGLQNQFPTWSPDGSQIAFTSNRDYRDAEEKRYRRDLYVMEVDGANQRRITQTGGVARPRWSPKRDMIAYEWNVNGNEIFLYHFSSGESKKLETGLEFSGNPLWNRTGSKLLIFGRETGHTTPEMRLINIYSGEHDILRSIPQDEDIIGRDYDWYDEP